MSGGGVDHQIILNSAPPPQRPRTNHEDILVKAEFFSDDQAGQHFQHSSDRIVEYNNYAATTLLNLDTFQDVKSKARWNESADAKDRRLARNAARMREKRAKETEEEYRIRLAKNAEANRIRRERENEVQRTLRLMKNAARQRMRRATESPEERAKRLEKAAERMRNVRASEPKIEKPPLADRLIGY